GFPVFRGGLLRWLIPSAQEGVLQRLGQRGRIEQFAVTMGDREQMIDLAVNLWRALPCHCTRSKSFHGRGPAMQRLNLRLDRKLFRCTGLDVVARGGGGDEMK